MDGNEGQAPAIVNLGISGAAAIFTAWIYAGVSNQLSLARSLPATLGFEPRLFVHLHDMGHFLALGLVAAGLCGLFRRWKKGSKSRAILGISALSLLLAALMIPADLSNMSVRLAGDYGDAATLAVRMGSAFIFAASVPLAYAIARFLAQPYWRWPAIALGLVVISSHALVLRNAYHGVHFFMVLVATTFSGAALAGSRFPDFLTRRLSRQPPRFLRAAGLALAAAVAAFSIARPPQARVAAELIRMDGCLLPHFLQRLRRAPVNYRQEAIPPEMQEWFVDRDSHPPIPPTTSPLFPQKNPVVIFITIDCIRADVIMSKKYDAQLPGFAQLRDDSTSFSNARSTAPGTISSLADIFTGTHFSEQFWVPAGPTSLPFPDTHTRVNELLNPVGVKTITFTGAPGLLPSFGLMRGFLETTDLKPKTNQYASAETLLNATFKRLEKAAHQKVFLHLHFLEAHEPYNLGAQTGSEFERYLSEVQIVDSQLVRLMQFIRSHELQDRTLLIVTADHGEAFGEHGMVHHSATVYDELLRVPLMIWHPKQHGSVVDEPISLIDLGPTILDVFGVPTPGYFKGQSLVPFVRGEKPKLTRPILAEGRLKQTLVLRNGLKVIVDNYLHTVELYDLNTDPQELTSLADDEALLAQPLSLLRQFFEVHHNRTPGYTPPYRVW